jgi:riboflavin synthase
MYTGIVQGSFPVTAIEDHPGLRTLSVELPDSLRAGLEVGASVALDGVCLTVTRVGEDGVTFDAILETQQRTTLGGLSEGSPVNVERSARAGDEIGGHEISGHVDGTVEIAAIERPEGNCVLTLRMPGKYLRYVFPKGFIALNGCSLTVVDVDREAGTFTVHLIPETLRVTTFDRKVVGDRINFEIERRTQVIVDTVREMFREYLRSGELAALSG